jgi:hypothetical protein
MDLLTICYKLLKRQHDLHIVALSLDASNFFRESLLIFFDSLVESILDLAVQMHGQTVIILELFV